ncbi:MAG: Thivi_2564 family membrane protein [Holophaga sp.]|jgi:type IV secretory pathway TrbL component
MLLGHLIIVLVVIGILLWLINTYIPMQATIKRIMNAVVVIGAVLWVLSAFGILSDFGGIRVGHGGFWR